IGVHELPAAEIPSSNVLSLRRAGPSLILVSECDRPSDRVVSQVRSGNGTPLYSTASPSPRKSQAKSSRSKPSRKPFLSVPPATLSMLAANGVFQPDCHQDE